MCAVEIYCAAKVYYCRSAIALFYVYCAVSQTLNNRPVSFDVQKWLYEMGEKLFQKCQILSKIYCMVLGNNGKAPDNNGKAL